MDIMGVLAEDNKQLTLIYNSETSVGKQTLAYANASDKKLLSIDISKTKVTGTQWAEIASNLGVNIGDLVDEDHPNFVKNFGDKGAMLSSEDWIKILQHQPEVLKGCIVINGKNRLVITNPSDLVKHLGIEGEDIPE
ncbi:arsenate reductase [Formosa agariphila KMM 3901]|uniref:Arsenate reductase n=2 Tax=Formosa TaxID=225842 RepID=T2KHV2_FORAG|nr:arsenate reductase [Formosa agariphila KMM 3901]